MYTRRVVLAVLVAGVLVAAAVTTTVAVVTRSSGGGAVRPGPRLVYAYRTVHEARDQGHTRSELVVMNGTRRIGSAPLGVFDTDPAFTTDGRYAFSLSDDQIVAVSVATGKATTMPCEECESHNQGCHCSTVVPIGGSEIAWLDRGEHLTRVDLAARAPARQRADTAIPTWHSDVDDVGPELLAGTAGAALVGYPDLNPMADQTGPAYLVTPDGRLRQLAPSRQDSIEAAAFSRDGTRVALSGDRQPDVCATVTVVTLAGVMAGAGVTSPVNAAPGTGCATRDGYVGTLWWDHDGTLNAYFEVDSNNPTNASQRRLDGDQWLAAGTEPASQAHQMGPNVTAILSHPGISDEGILYLAIDSHRTMIDRDVTYMTAAP